MYSDDTAREIDAEVKRIIAEAIERVRNILDVRYDALVALTNRLIEIESVDHQELKLIVDENSSGPIVVPGTSIESRNKENSRSDEQSDSASSELG